MVTKPDFETNPPKPYSHKDLFRYNCATSKRPICNESVASLGDSSRLKSKWLLTIWLISLFFDDRRAQQLVDLPLDGRPAIVLVVHAPRQLDELRAEVLGTLAQPDVVLDAPQRLVDLFELPG